MVFDNSVWKAYKIIRKQMNGDTQNGVVAVENRGEDGVDGKGFVSRVKVEWDSVWIELNERICD